MTEFFIGEIVHRDSVTGEEKGSEPIEIAVSEAEAEKIAETMKERLISFFNKYQGAFANEI